MDDVRYRMFLANISKVPYEPESEMSFVKNEVPQEALIALDFISQSILSAGGLYRILHCDEGENKKIEALVYKLTDQDPGQILISACLLFAMKPHTALHLLDHLEVVQLSNQVAREIGHLFSTLSGTLSEHEDDDLITLINNMTGKIQTLLKDDLLENFNNALYQSDQSASEITIHSVKSIINANSDSNSIAKKITLYVDTHGFDDEISKMIFNLNDKDILPDRIIHNLFNNAKIAELIKLNKQPASGIKLILDRLSHNNIEDVGYKMGLVDTDSTDALTALLSKRTEVQDLKKFIQHHSKAISMSEKIQAQLMVELIEKNWLTLKEKRGFKHSELRTLTASELRMISVRDSVQQLQASMHAHHDIDSWLVENISPTNWLLSINELITTCIKKKSFKTPNVLFTLLNAKEMPFAIPELLKRSRSMSTNEKAEFIDQLLILKSIAELPEFQSAKIADFTEESSRIKKDSLSRAIKKIDPYIDASLKKAVTRRAGTDPSSAFDTL